MAVQPFGISTVACMSGPFGMGKAGESTTVNPVAINESTVRASAAYVWMILIMVT